MNLPITRALLLVFLSCSVQAQDSPLPNEAIARLGSHRFDHADIVGNLIFTPDGSAIFAHCYREIVLWDVATGKQKKRLEREDNYTDAISPDGRRAALSQRGPLLRVFDAVGGKKLCEINDAVLTHPEAIHGLQAVAINKDGSVVATGTREITLWDVASGVKLKRWDFGATCVRALQFSPDGRFLAAGLSNRNGMMIDPSGMAIFSVKGERDPVQLDGLLGYRAWLEFSPNGDRIAGTCQIESAKAPHRPLLRVWDPTTGKPIWELNGYFDPCSFSPDGRLLAAVDLGNVVILDANNGRERHRLPRSNEHIQAMAFSPDGKMLATAQGKRIRLWETKSWKEIHPGIGHAQPTKAVAVAPDGRTIATGGLDCAVILWSWPEGTIRHRIDGIGSFWGVRHLTFSPRGDRLAAVAWINYEAPFFVFDTARGALLSRFGKERQGLACEFLPDGGKLLTAAGRDLNLWEPDTGVHIRNIGKLDKEPIHSLRPVGNTHTVWWSGEHQQLGLRDLNTGEDLRLLEDGHHHSDSNLILSPEGDWLAAGNTVWDLKTGEVVVQGRYLCSAMSISPDGRLLAWSDGRRIGVLEKRTRKIIHRFGPVVGAINQLAFTPDSALLISSGDADLLVWDMTGLLSNDIRSLPELALEPNEIDATWSQLASDDGWQGHQAEWKFAAGGRSAVEHLVQHVRPATAPDAVKLQTLRAALEDQDYDKRELAARELVDLGVVLKPEEIEALRQLREQIERAREPVFLTREEILALYESKALPSPTNHIGHLQSDPGASPPMFLPLRNRMRELRAIAALERSRVPLAEQHLETLAGGDPASPLTRESRFALARIRQRKQSSASAK